MSRWPNPVFQTLERTPTSPASLQRNINHIVFNSTVCRCKVEAVNPDTGEYRVVLSGTYCPTEESPTVS